MSIENYDPNIRWSTHTYKCTFQAWAHKCEFEVSVKGNCKGVTLFENCIESICDSLIEQQGDAPEITMRNKDGDTMIYPLADDGYDRIERELGLLCVAIELIAHEETPRTNNAGAAA